MRVHACTHWFDADWWRAVTRRKEGCQYALSPLSCSLSTLQSAWHWCQRVCLMRVGCVCRCPCFGRKWLWETQQYSPTVNIIQYHPTGINMVVLLLAEMCCCFSLSEWPHFLAPTCFLLGMCWMMADGRDLPQERLSWGGLSFVPLLWSGSLCARVCLLDYTVCRLSVIPLLQCSFNKTSKYCRYCRFCIRCYNYIVSCQCFFFRLLLNLFVPLFLCYWLWWGGVQRELMTGISTAEMSDQMLSQHDHQPGPCWWIMNTAHLNSDLWKTLAYCGTDAFPLPFRLYRLHAVALKCMKYTKNHTWRVQLSG